MKTLIFIGLKILEIIGAVLVAYLAILLFEWLESLHILEYLLVTIVIAMLLFGVYVFFFEIIPEWFAANKRLTDKIYAKLKKRKRYSRLKK